MTIQTPAHIVASRAAWREANDRATAIIEADGTIDEAYIAHVGEWGEEADAPSIWLDAYVAEEAMTAAAEPEGLPLLVLTDDEATAREVALLMGDACYPGRTFGRVLHVEPLPGERYGFDTIFEVTLEVR